VAVAVADGRLAGEALRVLVVPSSPWAQQAAMASTTAQATEAERVVAHSARVEARWCAWVAAPGLGVIRTYTLGRSGAWPDKTATPRPAAKG
jgi:hypothetical protein